MLFAAFLLPLIVIGLGLLLEKLRPACAPSRREAAFNIAYMLAFVALQSLISPAVLGMTAMVVGAFGGGLVFLPAEGLGLLLGALAYVVVMDLGEYIFHRAQHAVPALWALHSLHHSDPAMNVSTAIRHFWLEQAIKSVTVYLVVSLIFVPSPIIIGIYGVAAYYNYFSHMNLRIGFGRFVFLNSPQNHRIHHSTQPQHQGKNFAALFPIIDVIGGTYHRPGADEYPATGLDDGDRPLSLVEAIFWPARGLLRQHRWFSSPAN
jgi:sterol desaturase/sphingolipid hydroxylase (fatty acid hydroxylase superfamily)